MKWLALVSSCFFFCCDSGFYQKIKKKIDSVSHFFFPPERRPLTSVSTIYFDSSLTIDDDITRQGRSLTPSLTGFVVADLLKEHFPDFTDVGFTAKVHLRA